MNSSFRIVFALIVTLMLSACKTTQPPKWIPSDARTSGIIAQIYGVVGSKEWYETSVVVLITYQTRDGQSVKVLFGPNDGVQENARGRIWNNGDFELEAGFAYVYVTTPTTSPRPCIRTPRVNARGKGCGWAVQILPDPSVLVGPPFIDRIYFTEGDEVDCKTNPQLPPVDFRLTNPIHHTFTSFSDIGATFSPEASYVASTGYTPDPIAFDFAHYLDTFTTGAGLPKMYP